MGIVHWCVNGDHIDKDAQILNYKSEGPDAEGNYAYSFDTSNGIQQEENGNLERGAAGYFAFVSPEGDKYTLTYTANENGFQPTGDHLPTPPPTPEAILKSLEYLAAHPPQETTTQQ